MSSAAAARLAVRARRRPVGVVALGVLMYATGPVIVAASVADGPTFALVRLALGVPVLGVLAVNSVMRSRRPVSAAAVGWTVAAGMAFGVHQLLFMTAVKLTSVTSVVLMNTLAPLVVTGLAIPMFRERPARRVLGWTLVAMSGVAWAALGGGGGVAADALGTTLAGANVVVFSLFFVCSKASRDHIDVWPFLWGVIIVAFVAVALFFVSTERAIVSLTQRDVLLAATLACGPGAVGHFLMTWPLRWVPATVPPVLRLAQPLLSGGLAWLVLGQAVTAAQVLGGALTIVGVGAAMGAPRVQVPDAT